MKNYHVTLECIYHHTLDIEADNIEEAIGKAKSMHIPHENIKFEECLPINADSTDGTEKWNL